MNTEKSCSMKRSNDNSIRKNNVSSLCFLKSQSFILINVIEKEITR